MNRLCTPEQAEAALREFGLLDKVRAAELRRGAKPGPLRKPTRQDYIEMGVDPAVLDEIGAA